MTSPYCPGPLRAALSWPTSAQAGPWRGDLVRAALAPLVVAAAAVSPGRAMPLTVVGLVAAAYLLLVGTAALGRLDSGVAVPGGLLLGLDALHLLWASHLTTGLGGPLPVVAATAAACVLLRVVLVPPLPARPCPPPAARPAPGGALWRPLPFAEGTRCECLECLERLERARAEA